MYHQVFELRPTRSRTQVQTTAKKPLLAQFFGCNLLCDLAEKQGKNDMIDKLGGELQQGAPCELSQPTGAALILHPGIEDNAPADIVTAQQDFGGLGGKRRTRRPFTVMEVEALVQAVELLGTGR